MNWLAWKVVYLPFEGRGCFSKIILKRRCEVGCESTDTLGRIFGEVNEEGDEGEQREGMDA